jgi:drug/metabolite transporter (DMT)-like permease
MVVFWGCATAVLIGLGDLMLARITDRTSIISLMVVSSSGGVVTGLLAVAVIDSEISVDAIALGALAGLAMGAALAFYLRAMTVATIAITSPVTAVLSALWPLLYEVVVDDVSPSAIVLGGVGLALLSLALTTWSPETKGSIAAGLRWAALSGTCYGAGNIILGHVDEAAGMWPSVSHRVVGVAMFIALATTLRLPPRPPVGSRASAFVGGVFGTLALVAFLLGVQAGSLGVLSVTAGLFPAVSVTLLALFLGHPLRWWQAIGIGGAIAGVGVIAIG